METNKIKKNIRLAITLLLTFTFFLTSCSPKQGTESPQRYGQAEVLFRVNLPQPLPDGSSLVIEVLDDVTGLAFNPTRYEMIQQDETNYYVKLPLVIGSVLKYRYSQITDSISIESSPLGKQVRFRMANITGPEIFQDYIAAWSDIPFNGSIGRVRGQFVDQSNNSPIPNLLVTAQGVQTVTASDGTFTLEGLSLGTHNLVAYSMDGKYESFQQGVVISEEATTPVFISLEKRQLVKVTFNVDTPADFDSSIPIRFASNMETLGNEYTDLGAGSTALSANLPELTKVKDGRYSITLELPAGFDLRYKYTLGDGLWNSELSKEGSFVLRELIVERSERTISDTVTTFRSPELKPIVFNVTTPLNTPLTDTISIQFNPFGWFQPVEMIKTGDYQWVYTLYSPLHLLGPVNFRFCRNSICEISTSISSSEQIFTPSTQITTINVTITKWTGLGDPVSLDVMTEGSGLSPRPAFIAGFEFTSENYPAQNKYQESVFSGVIEEAANVVIIPSIWTATRNSPPYIEPLPGIDDSLSDMQETITLAKQKGLQVILFPQLSFPQGASEYWSNANRDEGWWITWYENYHRYLMQIADLAAINNVDGIIMGDPSVAPSYGGGKLANGSMSGAPANADEQWRQLILDVRSRFSGTVLGAMSYPSSQTSNPAWLDSVDQIYIIYSPALTPPESGDITEFSSVISQDLDGNLYPTIQGFGKSIIIGINYPSSSNALSGCTDTLGSCLNNWGASEVDLSVQSQIYNAAILAAAKEPWISGFVSRNYQGFVYAQDISGSIYEKPAYYVLWFWYHYILNVSS